MMRLRKPRLNKRPLLILAAVVLVAVASCLGGWWYAAHSATNDYRSHVGGYAATTANELKESGNQFKALAKEGDVKKTVEALGRLGDTLDKQASGAPDLPQLFGITLTPQEDTNKRGDIIGRLKQLAADVQAAKTLLVYQDAAALALQEVTTKTGANAAQQKALAEAWAAMAVKLQALQPPPEAQGIHQQIIAVIHAVQPKLAALPDLFNKKDINGFAAKQKEIDAHINELRALAGSIQLLNVNHDKAIARDYQRLLEILK